MCVESRLARLLDLTYSSLATIRAINATKEVILSAGAINTPQLLLLSGIGPSSSLAAAGISKIVNLPAVGQHLSDHILVTNQFSVAAPEDDFLESIGRNSTLLTELLTEWETNKQGQMGNGPSNLVGWLRVPEANQTWSSGEDPSAGPTSPHYELLFSVRCLCRACVVDSHLTSRLRIAWIRVNDRDTSIHGQLHDYHLGARVTIFERFRDPCLFVPVRLAPNRSLLSQHVIRHPGNAGRHPFGCELRLSVCVERLRYRTSRGLRGRRFEFGFVGRRVRSLPGNHDMASDGHCQDGALRRHEQRR